MSEEYSMFAIGKADLIRMYLQDGLSTDSIGKRLGCSAQTVNRRLRDYGIPVRHQGPPSGKYNPSWRGGRIVTKRGYVLLWMPSNPSSDAQGYIAEHRLVMERVLGRPLKREEIVHHRNGNRQDNRPENLEVMANGDHVSLHQTCPLPPKQVLEGWYLRDKMTMTEIAALLKRHPTTIRGHFLKLGIPIRKSNALRMVPMPENLVELYQTKSLRELAREIGCSVAAVADALRRQKALVRKPGLRRGKDGVLRPPAR